MGLVVGLVVGLEVGFVVGLGEDLGVGDAVGATVGVGTWGEVVALGDKMGWVPPRFARTRATTMTTRARTIMATMSPV